jgi:hypothetical protein
MFKPYIIGCVFLAALSCNEQKKDSNQISKPDEIKVQEIGKNPDSLLNRTASLLAGSLKLSNDSNLQKTIDKLNISWNLTAKEKFAPIRSWCVEESIDSINKKPYGVFYPFSGPDFPFVNAFYPDASIYILAGLEEAGNKESLIFSKNPDYGNFIKNAERYFFYSNRLGFFRTNDMAEQFAEKGVIDILAFYLNKSNCKIVSMSLMKWNSEEGFPEKIQKDDKANICHVEYLNEKNNYAQLYYFKKDISDEGLQKDTAWLKWVKSQMTNSTLVSMAKSASYLMSNSYFSSVRNFILDHSKLHIQDDTGIGFNYILKSNRKYKLYGKYTRTIPLFKNSFNQQLKDEYASEKVKKLPFKIGYNAVYGESNLQVLY